MAVRTEWPLPLFSGCMTMRVFSAWYSRNSSRVPSVEQLSTTIISFSQFARSWASCTRRKTSMMVSHSLKTQMIIESFNGDPPA
jgi:predicted Na+-dependent transporter